MQLPGIKLGASNSLLWENLRCCTTEGHVIADLVALQKCSRTHAISEYLRKRVAVSDSNHIHNKFHLGSFTRPSNSSNSLAAATWWSPGSVAAFGATEWELPQDGGANCPYGALLAAWMYGALLAA